MDTRRVNVRKRRTYYVMLFVIILLFLVLLFHIRNINSQLKELKVILSELEISSYEAAPDETMSETVIAESVRITEGIDVEKPADRTFEQTLEKLQELASRYAAIDEIYQNYSLYPEELLAALANNPEICRTFQAYMTSVCRK